MITGSNSIVKIKGVKAKPILNRIPILIRKCFQISKLLLNSIEKNEFNYKRSILINILQIIFFSNSNYFYFGNNNPNNFLSIPKFQKIIELSKERMKKDSIDQIFKIIF